MSDDYAALLKNARDIPILNTGIDKFGYFRMHLSYEGTSFITYPHGQDGKYTFK